MLPWCGSGSGGSAAPPPCSFSILFPVSGKLAGEEAPEGGGVPISSVDCTLSLGTPYTRQQPSSSSSTMQWSSALCWNKVTTPGKQSSCGNASGGSAVAAATGGGSANLGGDPLLLARRCANCDTTSTPLWRNGPRGPKSLCNACGIRYKKEERRAVASSTSSCHKVGEGISYAYGLGQTQHPWGCYAPAAAVTKSSVIYGSGEGDEQREMYLPWRLNVVPPQFPINDRTGLFQYQ